MPGFDYSAMSFRYSKFLLSFSPQLTDLAPVNYAEFVSKDSLTDFFR